MSTVYSALDERLDRPVAVKVMSPALSTDPAFADRFAREARVAARLSHLNAVSVYDQGVDGEHVFLVMELVRGRTLRDLLRERGRAQPGPGGVDHGAGAGRAGRRAPGRPGAPGREAGEHPAVRRRRGEGGRLRAGPRGGSRCHQHPDRADDGHRGLLPAGADLARRRRCPLRRVLGRRACSSNCSPAARPTPATARWRWPTSTSTPTCRRRPAAGPACPASWTSWCCAATSREPSGRPLDAGALLAELHDVRVDLGLPVIAGAAAPAAGADPDDTQQIERIVRRPPVHAAATAARPSRPAATPTTAPDPRPGLPGQRHPVHRRSGRAPGRPSRTPAAATAAGRRCPAASGPAGGPSLDRAGVLLGLLTGWGAWYLTVGRYHQVPNVSGQSQSAAVSVLRKDGFTVNPAGACRRSPRRCRPAG